MRRAMKRAGLEYIFIDATIGGELSHEWLQENVSSQLLSTLSNRVNRSITRNIIACADSHRRAQRWVANQENSQFFLILEDDAVLETGFVVLWKSLKEAMFEFGRNVVFVGYSLPDGVLAGSKLTKLGSTYELLEYPAEKTLGAYGYLLDSTGAKLLSGLNADKIMDTADNFQIRHRGIAPQVATVAPRLVTTGNFSSSIGWTHQKWRQRCRVILLWLPFGSMIYRARQRRRF